MNNSENNSLDGLHGHSFFGRGLKVNFFDSRIGYR